MDNATLREMIREGSLVDPSKRKPGESDEALIARLYTSKGKLPPDPDCDDTGNERRRETAAHALGEFMAATGTDARDAICDLLCNLMHLCDRDHKELGTFAEGLERGRKHWRTEIGLDPDNL